MLQTARSSNFFSSSNAAPQRIGRTRVWGLSRFPKRTLDRRGSHWSELDLQFVLLVRYETMDLMSRATSMKPISRFQTALCWRRHNSIGQSYSVWKRKNLAFARKNVFPSSRWHYFPFKGAKWGLSNQFIGGCRVKRMGRLSMSVIVLRDTNSRICDGDRVRIWGNLKEIQQDWLSTPCCTWYSGVMDKSGVLGDLGYILV